MDRLRTLPIARGSVIAGRTIAEMVELAGGIVVVAICGLLVGWAPHGSVLETAAAFGLLLLAAFAVTWAGTYLGLLVRDPDGADGIAMAFIFPLMFLSGIFVPVAGLPSPLREFAEINPLTALATAMRELFHVPTGPLPDVWTLQHPDPHDARLGRRADGRLRAARDPALPADGPLTSSLLRPGESSRSAAASPR